MKRIMLFLLSVAATVAAVAQTLNVEVGSVTYQFPAAEAGEMVYADGTSLTILNKVFRSVSTNGDLQSHLLKGVHITAEPEDATHIRFDIIRSLDSPMLDTDTMNLVDALITSALDFQLYHLQR